MSDILVIGGGIIGLAIALELRLKGLKVTLLSQDFHQAASHAAAGMLAPQAEAIPPSPLLDLCLQSRALYPDWVSKLEQLSGLATGYWACGILAPTYDLGDRQRAVDPSAQWLDAATIHQHQPGLSSEVVGGWWFPQDGQVDNQALMKALWLAAKDAGVAIQEGVTVTAIQHQQQRVTQLQTSDGEWQAEHYVLATGAWSQTLLSVPVTPRKGQMLSVQVPSNVDNPLPLRQVLFGCESYIVPRQDGRIVIGATSEAVGFQPGNTPKGIATLLNAAIRLYPELQHFPIQEFWWGFRPTTPDEAPILGTSPYTNLTLAVGHYRNGILLAPITVALVTELILHQAIAPLLAHFHYSRFANGGSEG